MINLTDLLIPVLTIATIATAMIWVQRRGQTKTAVAVLSAAMLVFLNAQPAQAAMATKEDVLNSKQAAFEDNDLKLNPGGRHYSGIEYVDEEAAPGQRSYSDVEIEREIKSINSRLIAGVVNGSVIISGRVADKDTAKDIVEQVKEIPGVHEVTFELGLEQGEYRQ
jgi:hypothetical protein